VRYAVWSCVPLNIFGEMKRWRVAIETALAVALIIGIRLVVDALDADFIALSPLYSSIVAGGIFVIGLLVAGTLADYKEAERMPSEIVAAMENIHEDARSIMQLKPDFNFDRLKRSLAEIVTTLREDLETTDARATLIAVNALSASFVELERLDVPANYIVRLRAEQGLIRKAVLRIYHIQRIDFMPSAYTLIQTIVGLIIAALVFTRIDLAQSIVLLVFISYFFIYLVRLLRILDMPFRVGTRSMDDVSRFLLKEFADRMQRDDA
jgi:hypothetical protein